MLSELKGFKADLPRSILKWASTKIKSKTHLKYWVHKNTLKKSGLFDANYYLQQAKLQGVSISGSPLKHFFFSGSTLQIDPHILFDCKYYCETNADVSARKENPLLHYIRYGSGEDRSPHPAFSEAFYKASLSQVPPPHKSSLESYLFDGSNGNPNLNFDTKWYLQQNKDVVESGINPFLHYLKIGHKEDKNPHPEFDEKWYKEQYKDEIPNDMSGLEYHMRFGLTKNRFINKAEYRERRNPHKALAELKTVLVVAHEANDKLYGAERSLLAVLQLLDAKKFRIILALPSPGSAYLDLVRRHVDGIYIYKKEWWNAGVAGLESNAQLFEKIINEETIDLVYVNTIMVPTPSILAKLHNIPSITHVRELIDRDDELTRMIGLGPAEIIQKVQERSDVIIANSNETFNLFAGEGNALVVSNAISVPVANAPNVLADNGVLHVGMLSSNIQKKGIFDFYDLACKSEEAGAKIEYHAFGPLTKSVKKIQNLIRKNNGPNNLHFPGYAADAKAAISQMNVILNVSRFAESFGRTAIEAMAGNRPIIGYHHGALPDVITHDVTGYLIPYAKPEAALPYLEAFLKTPEKLSKMGRLGRKMAHERYSYDVLRKNINASFETALLGQPENVVENFERLKGASSIVSKETPSDVKVSVVIPNYNYASYIEERISSILSQTLKPAEIIFLDDASNDESVAKAETLLQAASRLEHPIPYRIVKNTNNEGVYKQWLKGINLAKYPWIWIAEADDTSESNFLEELTRDINPQTNLVYCQSRKINKDGNEISPNNLEHTRDLSSKKWLRDYTESGIQEVTNSLAYRNSIPNVSSAIFRKEATLGMSSHLTQYRFCGDWFFYCYLLRSGEVNYVSRPLNNFRRHDQGVTRQSSKTIPYLKEVSKIREYVTREFPILPRQIERMNWFLDRDYKIEDVEKNSLSPQIEADLQTAISNTHKRKRIAFITTNNGSHNGGSEMLWQEAALELRSLGHDVVVLIKNWRPQPEILRRFINVGIKLLFKEGDGVQALVKLNPDLTIISIGDQDEGTEYYSDLQANKCAYVIVNQLTKEERFWKIRKHKTALVKAGYKAAKAVFFTSRNNHKVMEKRLDDKINNAQFHFNPYHIDRNNTPAYPNLKNGFQIAIPSKILFMHKGQDLLIEAIDPDLWAKRDVQFNFYGAGPDRKKLQTMISNAGLNMCHIKGRVDNIEDIWASNHALLMPSKMEGLPIMVVSAMLSARPCILTDIGGHSEVINDGESGFIIQNPTSQDIKVTLERAYNERMQWEAMGEVARQDILEYLPDNPVENFISQLEPYL